MYKDVPVRPQVIAKLEGNLQTKLNIARIIARAEHLSKLVIRPAIQAVAIRKALAKRNIGDSNWPGSVENSKQQDFRTSTWAH
jgi:hypothetical protein